MQAETMWKALWKKWTIDKPALLGDWLWDVFVLQLAEFLDRLTLRRIIAFIPVVILVLAYYHRIPIPPELMLVGDFFAYIDIFAVVFLVGVLSRAATVLFSIRHMTAQVVRLVSDLLTAMRVDFRHRRKRGTKSRKRLVRGRQNDDDAPAVIGGLAWA
jgi:hypothetical protein